MSEGGGWSGVPFVGGLIEGWRNSQESSYNRDFQAGQAQTNREFQERLAGSGHQREVADLRAAGLNPILSGTGGPGSITPAGSGVSGSQAVMPSFSATYSSALQARKNSPEVQLLHQQAENQSAQASATAAGIRGILEENRRKTAEAAMAEHAERGMRTEGAIDSTAYGKYLRYIDRGVKTVSPFVPTTRYHFGN